MQPCSNSRFRHKVLYVEDQPVNSLLMSALFERVPDCDLVPADCGRRALEVAQGLYPSLLLLDLRLPDIHGTELLPRLRHVHGCEQVPAVAVTAEHGFEIEGSGFDELWRKPLNLLSVLERVEGYLALAEAQRRSPLPQLEIPPLCTPALVARLAQT